MRHTAWNPERGGDPRSRLSECVPPKRWFKILARFLMDSRKHVHHRARGRGTTGRGATRWACPQRLRSRGRPGRGAAPRPAVRPTCQERKITRVAISEVSRYVPSRAHTQRRGRSFFSFLLLVSFLLSRLASMHSLRFRRRKEGNENKEQEGRKDGASCTPAARTHHRRHT